MKQFLILISLLISNICLPQMDMDSLMNELTNTKIYQKTDTIDYMMGKFQRFEKINGREYFDVCLDSLGKLSSYLELAVVHRLVDQQNRPTKTIGYDLRGDYSFWDYPPIQETTYSNDTTIQMEYNKKYKLLSKITTVNDKKGRAIEIINENIRPPNFDKTLNSYNDSKKELIIVHLDENKKPKKDSMGVVYIYQKFDSNNNIIEKKYMDIHYKLVDAAHDKNICVFSIIKREYKDGIWFTYFHDSKGKKVCEENDSNPFILILDNSRSKSKK